MPLNPVQRKTIREVLSDQVDSIFGDPLAEQFLPRVIENVSLSIPDVIAHLQQDRHLIHDLMTAVNLDGSMRSDLNKLLDKLDSERAMIPQSLLYGHPNYNPMNIVELKKFGDCLVDAHVEEPYRSSLMALRELFLEMTPLNSANSYADESRVYTYRIGSVPLNLDKVGNVPSRGEVSEEVLEYVTLRLKWKKKYDELKAEYDSSIEKLNEGTIVMNVSDVDDNSRDRFPLPMIKPMNIREGAHVDDSDAAFSSSPLVVFYGSDRGDIGRDDISSDVKCCLGLEYHFRGENSSSMNKAIHWYAVAAEQGHLLALLILRYCYLNGLGVEKDTRFAHEFTSKFNHYLKEHATAIEQNEYSDTDLSFKLLGQMASKHQNRVLHYLMGACCYYGLGVRRSDPTAAGWYRLAADQGDAVAQNILGDCYYSGRGVDQCYEEAVKYYRLAADQELADARNNLGNCYYNGRGVEKSDEEAARLYRLAAEQGLAAAQNNLGGCYFKGEGIEKSYDEAMKWYRLSADQGYARAQNNLGNRYRHGEGVEQNEVEAFKWYQLAADQGLAAAQSNLGYCYQQGIGVEKNDEEAVKWYQLAANQGNTFARDVLNQLSPASS